MKNKNYRVSRATLYNTIELLLDCDLVIKHQFGKNIAQFEKAFQCSQHDHLIDVDSGEVIEFCDPRINQIINTAAELYKFSPVYHSLYIYGTFKKINLPDLKAIFKTSQCNNGDIFNVKYFCKCFLCSSLRGWLYVIELCSF